MPTEVIAADALDAISRDSGLVDAFGYGDAETRLWKSFALGEMQTEVSARNATSLAKHGLVFGRGAYTRTAREALVGRGIHVPDCIIYLDAETRAAFGAATCEDLATTDGSHAGTETVVTFALQIAGLISTFGGHDATRLKIMRERLESIDNLAYPRQAGRAWRNSREPLDWATSTYPQRPLAAGIRVVYVNRLAPLP